MFEFVRVQQWLVEQIGGGVGGSDLSCANQQGPAPAASTGEALAEAAVKVGSTEDVTVVVMRLSG